jgi:L-alanine-DL-glutamate epimerase-like enolase superfamily enzyme
METGAMQSTPLKLRIKLEQWPLKNPFRITGHTWVHLDVLLLELESRDGLGRGEAAGVYYKHDTPARMLRQLEDARRKIETGITREEIQQLLPPGGARNAIDCAMWDLEASASGTPVWEAAHLSEPRPLVTTLTCGADDPQKMAANALAYKGARAIKMKLTGEPADADRVRAIREARPDVWLGVDGNQGFTRRSLEALIPVLLDARISLIEQPFPAGEENWLDGLGCPVPIAADESVQSLADIAPVAHRVNVVNIKLDKCGGLTEGLAMARMARDLGLDCMVGNMLGTSLAMAPAFVLGQLCKIVDLDGPVFLKTDRETPVRYSDGFINCPSELWGGRRTQRKNESP